MLLDVEQCFAEQLVAIVSAHAGTSGTAAGIGLLGDGVARGRWPVWAGMRSRARHGRSSVLTGAYDQAELRAQRRKVYRRLRQ
jgi:hypothetical protein